MDELLRIAAHNSLAALALASCIYVMMRVWRNPPLAHLLWLLVLLKLICPPLIELDGSPFRRLASFDSESAPVAVSPPIGNEAPPPLSASSEAVSNEQTTASNNLRPLVASAESAWITLRSIVFLTWLCGSAIYALVTLSRALRFERALRDTLPGSLRLRQTAAEIALKLGVRRVPDVRYVESAAVPFLWCFGRRPTIVLPMRLRRDLDDTQLAMILAHELAHLKRRDHWVRGVEMIVSIVYWWNPLVGFVRRQLHRAEDLCCDAWVRCSHPQSIAGYAELVFEVAESLSRPPLIDRPLPASPFLRSHSLKARIEMILHSRFSPQLSIRSIVFAILVAVLVMPSFIQTSETAAAADPQDEQASQATKASSTAPLPHKVAFEQGATKFEQGDEITILEIRGTAPTFAPGNIYWIRGSYKLGSCDQATLAAFTTATKAGEGRSRYLKVQRKTVERGEGTFTLYLPMSYEGLPHVSYYGGDGEGMGGNYFGTGDSVLKKWWGS